MIVTRRFVFLHLHKSGGTFINRFLLDHFPDARQIGYHLPRSHIPEPCRGMPIIGTVRNPWDYYVSWHSFQSAKPEPNPLFRAVSDNGRLNFGESISRLLTLADNPYLLEKIRASLPERLPGRGINLTRQCLAPLVGSGLGFYSFMYRRMYGQADDIRLLDMNTLRENLLPALEEMGVIATPGMRAQLRDSASLNRSEHAHYSKYYDTRLAELVAERDAELIGRHHYRFEISV